MPSCFRDETTTPLVVATPTANGIPERVPRAKILMCTCALVFIGFLNGSQDVTYRVMSLLPTPPIAASAMLVKTLLGTLPFIPSMMWTSPQQGSLDRYWPVALRLALWNCLSGVCIYAGIARTDASRAAFLLQLAVVATPVLEWVVLKRSQPAIIWLGALMALLGVSLLTSPTEVHHRSSNQRDFASSLAGDFLVTLGAVLMAMYLVTTAGISSDADPARVQAIKYFFSLVFYTAWALISPMFCREDTRSIAAGWSDPRSWALMLYGSWIPGSFADVLQQWAQAHVRASEASLLLASEPVWALLIAVPLLGEHLCAYELVGGLLILSAAALASGVCAQLPAGEQNQQGSSIAISVEAGVVVKEPHRTFEIRPIQQPHSL